MTALAPPPVRTGEHQQPFQTPTDKRRQLLSRLSRLETDRSTIDPHWLRLGKFLAPQAARFFVDQRNEESESKYKPIYNNRATLAVRILVAGMMAGMTSQARPWMRLRTANPDLRDSHDVQVWLDDTTQRILSVFDRSNIYRILPKTYKELGVFGTSAQMILSDDETVIRSYPLTLGQYYLQQNHKGEIDTVYRKFQRTVGEVVKDFGQGAGWNNLSERVKTEYNEGNLESKVDLLHVVEPRADRERDLNSELAIDMPWRSIYLEIGSEDDRILRESGFKRMRILCPRWDVEGEGVYGTSPGMDALGDVAQLQQMEVRLSQGIDYQTQPPLQIPADMKGRRDGLPGGVSYYEPRTLHRVNQSTPHGGIRTAFEVDLRLDHMELLKAQVEQRIDRAFFVDLFLMISRSDGRMTATEVIERQEEKLLMIGPVIERLGNELLKPLIDITFHEMTERGMLRPPPPELEGEDYEVEFVSILAQAQRAVNITGTQQYMQDVLTVAQAQVAVGQEADVLDNVDLDEWAQRTARMRGVDSEMLVDKDGRSQLRAARAERAAVRERAELGQMQAQTAKDLSSAPIDQGTALDAALQQVVGATPQ